MNTEAFSKETEAMKSLLALFESAKRTRRLFDEANMSLPEPLARFLGEERSRGPTVREPTLQIPSPDWPKPPADVAGTRHITVRLNELAPTTLVVALLQKAGGPLRAKELVGQVQNILPNASYGTIMNIGSRLSDDLINKGSDGWSLKAGAKAPLIHGDRAWGEPELFSKQDVAAHRREAVEHLLRLNPGGLQIVQVVEQLKLCEWMLAPVSKDLVKIDVQELAQEGRAQRVGNSKKWRALLR